MIAVPHADLPYENFRHPGDSAELADLIKDAACRMGRVRVRGSLHSERDSALSERADAYQVMLDGMTHVTIDRAAKTVTVQAGASMGGDPFAPLGPSNPQFHASLSLFNRINEANLAIPITGGITHQTISGFLATGADGGSLSHSFPSCVIEITLIDGTGTPRVLERGQAEFDAALASLGLLGVLSSVKLQCETRYDIIGMRSTQPDADGDFSLFGANPARKPTIADFLMTKPYARAMWWPQPGVERVELWEADRFDPKRHGRWIKDGRPPAQSEGVPSRNHQRVAGAILAVLATVVDPAKRQKAEELLKGVMLANPVDRLRKLRALFGQLPADVQLDLDWREIVPVIAELLANLAGGIGPQITWAPTAGAVPVLQSAYHPLSQTEQIVAMLIDLFVPLSPAASGWTDDDDFPRAYSVQPFYDSWHVGLPMDNPIDDRLLPVTFTEAWLPLENAMPALNALHQMFQAGRLSATGTFAIELYVACRSPAWLSASYSGPAFRIDPFWYDTGDYAARDRFFAQFWQVLEPFEPRYHWGKALPPATNTWLATLDGRFPKLRKQYDPHDVFLTEYWARRLSL
jgi:hypothetical protein